MAVTIKQAANSPLRSHVSHLIPCHLTASSDRGFDLKAAFSYSVLVLKRNAYCSFPVSSRRNNGRGAMEARDIQNIAPPEAPDLQRKICRVISRIKSVIHLVVALSVRVFTATLPVRRENDIELLGITQPVVFNEEDRDSNEPDQSTTADFQLHQSTVISNYRSVIQVTVALVFAGGSFGVMYQVPGGVNELGRAVLGDTIGFNVFLVADTLTLFASLAVAMVVATVSHISGKLEYFMCINLWAAVVGFVLTFLATEYVVVFPS